MAQNRRLSKRSDAILAHIARYRLSTPEALTRLFHDGSTEAMKSTVKGLRREPALIASAALHGHQPEQVYYHLTAEGAAVLGLPADQLAKPLDDPATRARRYGCLLHCTSGDVRRNRLTLPEFQECFRELWAPGSFLAERFANRDYCLERDGAGALHLGEVLVDTGYSLMKLVQKTIENAEDTLPKLLEAGRYRIALVLPVAAKCASVRHELGLRPHDRHYPRPVITVTAHPQLARLLDTRA